MRALDRATQPIDKRKAASVTDFKSLASSTLRLAQGNDGDRTACGLVIDALSGAYEHGKVLTIWELRTITGLPLHEVFAAIRTLEFGGIVSIEQNREDPFAATVHPARLPQASAEDGGGQ
ncbi:hypothetical protein P8Q88_14680 [Qipengyuania sp. XHP0207]|uniref:hypothetical protein n=1 Tax=Qipengyuania sp. XHP0207 TaxID=3038078 RepID=UPI00241CC874|nr:hypothetical protein [Qipengyuania sp. XHP0207]MDG5749422.1 hypothetical protein [Qipengyuania sp. XHP0207]